MNCFKLHRPFISLLKLNKSHFRPISVVQQKINHSYYFMPGDLLLSCSPLGRILDKSADQCGDKTAIISAFQEVSKSYTEFKTEVDRLASGLISQGLKKGDRIAICSPNCYEWSLTQFAAAKSGLILVNVNPASQSKELEYCLKQVDCKALVIWDILKTQDFYKILCEIIPELPKSKSGKIQSSSLPNLETVIMISEERKDGVLNFNDVADSGNKESKVALSTIERTIQFDDPLNIIFTSGTTGFPKGATLSHHNIVNNALVAGRRLGFNLLKPVVCCHVPLFHSFGCVLGSVTSIFFQGTCVFPALGYDAVSSLKAIEQYKCTVVFGTPTMYVDLIQNYKLQNFNTSSLKQACIGGAPVNETVVKDVQEMMNVPHVHIGYGITETSPAVALNGINEEFDNVVKGNLQPIEFVEVKIVDDKGELVPVNTQGELYVRGHNTFMGYWNDEKKTAEALDKTRWYHTGDLCVMDEQGYVRIVGRKSDMIIRGGVNLYPLEIENFLNTHPAVLEVHVCGVPDERLGEEACAWISIKKDMTLTEEEITKFCSGKISHYKVPRYIMFVEDFPKTQSGKIKKFEMANVSIQKLKL